MEGNEESSVVESGKGSPATVLCVWGWSPTSKDVESVDLTLMSAVDLLLQQSACMQILSYMIQVMSFWVLYS